MDLRSSFTPLIFCVCLNATVIVPASAQEPKEPTRNGKTLKEWILLLKSKDSNERAQAAWNIEQIAARTLAAREAVPDLIEALGDSNPYLSQSAHIALWRIGPDAVPALIEALQSKNERQRTRAASALGAIGPPAKAALPALTQLLKHKDWRTREYAARSLGYLRHEGKPAVPALLDAFKTEKSDGGGGG